MTTRLTTWIAAILCLAAVTAAGHALHLNPSTVGFAYLIVVLLTAGEFDPARQHHQVSDFITRRVDAIVLSPCDSKSIGTAIAEANQAGIPVFTVDIAALASGIKVVSHVATDNFGGGKMAATAMIEALTDGGKVAILDHPEVESVILRVNGFEAELAAHLEPQRFWGSTPIRFARLQVHSTDAMADMIDRRSRGMAACTASRMRGSAPVVRRQEPGAL